MYFITTTAETMYSTGKHVVTLFSVLVMIIVGVVKVFVVTNPTGKNMVSVEYYVLVIIVPSSVCVLIVIAV
jgi:archaellum biogenesis protein FlaJ (TadC family)